MGKRLLLAVTLIFVVGCGGGAKVDTNVPENWDERYTYKPCESVQTPNPQKRSLVAMLKALDENAWEVETASQVTHSIIAKGCKLPLLVECDQASFSVDVDGFISARPARRNFRSDLRDSIYGWLAHLNATFEEYRCADEEVLKRKAFNYKIDF